VAEERPDLLEIVLLLEHLHGDAMPQVMGLELGHADEAAVIPNFTRVIRATVLSTKQNLYVEAARAQGAPGYYIVLRHILPNIMAPILVLTTSAIAWAILTGAALNFLGLGTQPPTPEWGIDLSDGRTYLGVAWWMTTFPGLGIMVAVLGINLLGDGFRDILDPYLKQ
jgi:peptide/nickel transport system permease protein